jgi:ATP diphosphatase
VSLLVVPLAPEETLHLTLAEWDALATRARVWFERVDHPLAGRLRAEGVEVGTIDADLDPACSSCALVADPGSVRIVGLARRGATVTAGVASAPDALSAAHGAPVVRRATTSLGAVAVVMARLRSDDGCPWDREQSHASLVTHLLEEAYEVIDAVERDRLGAPLAEELGDLLLQVAFHARLAAQDGRFDLADVGDVIAAKLLRRHPHVFGDAEVADAAEVLANWERIKSSEKERSDPFEDIPSALPALLAAAKSQKRGAPLGFDVDEATAHARLHAAVGDLASAVGPDALGEALFWAVAWGRARGLDPESALRRRTARFQDEHRRAPTPG